MRIIFFTLILMSVVMPTIAQQKAITLYPNGVPNAKSTPATYVEKNAREWVTQVSIPTMIPYFPEKGKGNGTAIIIFPGGGYAGLSMDNEGYQIAKAFVEIGVTAFVVKYRLPSDEIMIDKTIGPLQDAQQAILTVRKRAAEWDINPGNIGIIGFSAGGHLASTLGTHYDKAVIENKDKTSLRPDFMILLYPVITFGQLAHAGSRDNLVGKSPSAAEIELYSNEKQVNLNTPITFLTQAGDDSVVPIQNSLLFYNALLGAKVKAEMHIFEEGGHGFGLNNSKSKDKWFDWCKNWLQENGIIAAL